MAKITNTGELRAFLCGAINSVSNGTLDLEKARNITKLAAQINESLYAEVKVARTKLDLSMEVDKIGKLNLGDND